MQLQRVWWDAHHSFSGSTVSECGMGMVVPYCTFGLGFFVMYLIHKSHATSVKVRRHNNKTLCKLTTRMFPGPLHRSVSSSPFSQGRQSTGTCGPSKVPEGADVALRGMVARPVSISRNSGIKLVQCCRCESRT